MDCQEIIFSGHAVQRMFQREIGIQMSWPLLKMVK